MKKSRLKYVLSTIVYLFAFGISYKYFVVEKFGYFGFGSGDFSLLSLFVIGVYSLIPSMILPLKSFRPSVYIFSIIFYVVYVPALFVVYDESLAFNISPALTAFMLFTCMTLNVASTRLPLARLDLGSISLGRRNVNILVLVVSASAVAVVLFRVSGNFSIIGLEDIYLKRAEVKNLELGKLSYLISWIVSFFLPTIIAWSLVLKKYHYVFLLFLVYIFLYFTLGAKLYLFVMGYFLLAYGYIRSLDRSNLFLPYSFSILLLMPILLQFDFLSATRSLYIGVINLRVFSIQGLAIPVYVEFFNSNPQTYFSHISIVSYFLDYPYGNMISVVLEKKYGLGNFNASYFVGDGFAALGYPGMIVITLLVSLFFYVFDVITHGRDHRFVILSVSVFVVSFSNVPFATSMLTGGGFLFFLYFIFSYGRTRQRV